MHAIKQKIEEFMCVFLGVFKEIGKSFGKSLFEQKAIYFTIYIIKTPEFFDDISIGTSYLASGA
jgi:hypothetical protein